MITENLSTLKIHKLTKEQYDRELTAGNIDETALYLTPEEEIDLSGYATVDKLNTKADADHNHNDLYYTETEVDTLLSNKANTNHNHDTAYDTKGSADTALAYAKSYTDTKTSSLAPTTVVDNKISTHNTSTSAHNDIRNLISGLTTRLNTLADSDDTTLDQMSEIVEYIKSNKTLIDSVTTSKVNVSDIVNNLTTNVTNKPLSAAQGVAIKNLIDTLQSELDSHTHAISDVSGLQSALDGKANTSHGNHVPATQTASNKVFLRNDNTWQTVTPANIGAAASSHTHKVANISDLTATATELNYMDGVTSSVQTQLDNKSDISHTHDEYMTTTNPTGTGSFSMNRNTAKAVGENSSAFGYYTIASGKYSFAEGRGDNSTSFSLYNGSTGEASHTEGYQCSATARAAHAEGYSAFASGEASHAEGWGTTASGSKSHAEGSNTTASGSISHAEGYYTTALGYQHAQGHYNNTSSATAGDMSGTTGTAFVIGCGTSSSKKNAFRVTYDGKIFATSSTITAGADYAEFFEWQDSNSNNEDRRGYFVTLDGNKIKIAEPDEYILGIVSGRPAMIGNGDEEWMGRYILDEFGDFITEEFEYEENIIDKETGETKTITKIGTKYKESPDYDPTIPYTQRDDRPEWDAVGMVGVLSVRDDGTCKVNGFCKVAEGGIATTSESGYRVIKRINENIVKVVFR